VGLRVAGLSALAALVHVIVLGGLEIGIYGDRPRSIVAMLGFAWLRWTSIFGLWSARAASRRPRAAAP
jgi:hypothetical protein